MVKICSSTEGVDDSTDFTNMSPESLKPRVPWISLLRAVEVCIAMGEAFQNTSILPLPPPSGGEEEEEEEEDVI